MTTEGRNIKALQQMQNISMQGEDGCIVIEALG